MKPLLTLFLLAVLATAGIANDSTKAKKHLVQLTAGYQDGLTLGAEIKFNHYAAGDSADEIRVFFYRDYWHPINKLALLYQPHVLPIWDKPFWKPLKPVGALGESVGYWRSRKRTYWPNDDAVYSANSHWKKNPTIGIVLLGGWEYTVRKITIEVYAMGGADIYGVNDWTRGVGASLKWQL